MRKSFIWMALLVALGLSGCQKNAQSNGLGKNDEQLVKTGDDLVGRWHFSGVAAIATNKDSAELNSFLAMPATAEMRDVMLDKLATAPFRLLSHKTANRNTNNYAPLIRPLLDDLWRCESYAEMRGPTNQMPELLLAVRLDNARTKLWQGNLASIISAWTAVPARQIRDDRYEGWEIKKHHDPDTIRCIRSGDWLLFGWASSDLHMQADFLRRIKENQLTVECSPTAFLDCIMNWPALLANHPNPLPFALPAKLPKMHLMMEAKSEFTRSILNIQFAQPLGLTLEPWKFPTNSIPVPFASFAAARGIAPWLSEQPFIKQLKLASVPNQASIFASRNPFDTVVAAPVSGASNYLANLAPQLANTLNAKLEGSRLAFMRATWANQQLKMGGLPFVNPYLKTVTEPAGEFLVAGLFPAVLPNNRTNFPPQLIKEIESKPNLVYYGWEMNQERIFQWQAINQVDLMVQNKNFPSPNSPVEKWLQAIKPRLTTCGTEVSLTSPTQLTLLRNSSLGFSGVELTALEYWLDAPDFPFHMEYPKPAVPPAKKAPRTK